MTVRICHLEHQSVRLRAAGAAAAARGGAGRAVPAGDEAPVESLPLEAFAALGYRHVVARGQKGYNGVTILSRLPLEECRHRGFCARGDARHVAADCRRGRSSTTSTCRPAATCPIRR